LYNAVKHARTGADRAGFAAHMYRARGGVKPQRHTGKLDRTETAIRA
jgi:protein tyrosine/serine phosphatase